MKIIGIEEHFLSPDVRASWAAAASAGQDASESLHLGDIQDRLEELSDERLARMDESGIDVQVLSLTSPGLHNLEPAEGISLARRTNDLIAATIPRHPDRFDGFATIPTTAPSEALRELERSVRDLGLKGGMLFGRTMEKNLDHPRFLADFRDCCSSAYSTLHPSSDAASRGTRGLLLRLRLASESRICDVRSWMALRLWNPVSSPCPRRRLRSVPGSSDHSWLLGRSRALLLRAFEGVLPRDQVAAFRRRHDA